LFDGLLHEDVVDDVAEHVGQSEISTGIPIGQFFVVETEQVQHGGVQVVAVDFAVDGFDSIFVGRSVGDSAPDASTGGSFMMRQRGWLFAFQYGMAVNLIDPSYPYRRQILISCLAVLICSRADGDDAG
jgi:hypothetical protein